MFAFFNFSFTKQATYLKNNKFNVSQPASVLNTIPGTKLAGDAPEIFALLQKGEAFLVGSFATAGELKKDIIEALVTQKARKAFKDSILSNMLSGLGLFFWISAKSSSVITEDSISVF